MGRKAKDAAEQKIGEWTGRRNMSKTTAKKENANASDENRIPLQMQSQSDLNSMKNCTVRLEKLRTESKTTDAVSKTPAKKVPIADVITKDKQAIYDYSFDADDTPGPMKETEDEMKDLFEKLAKDNIIEVKKYRPKKFKKTKTDAKNCPVKKAVTQKRRREKQPVDVEPPQKKRNLKGKVASVSVATKPLKIVAVEPSKGNGDDERRQVKPVNIEHVNAQPRLRNHNLQNLQSTPKTSTPLGTKSNAMNKNNIGSLNSMFFGNESPLIGRSTRSNIQKQRLQLSAINDSEEDVPNGNVGQNGDNENVPQFNGDGDDGDDFDFGNNDANEPEPDLDVDKENSLDRPSTSAQNRPSTSSAASYLWDQPSTSAAALRSLDKPGKSSSADKNRPGTSSGILRSLDRPNTSLATSHLRDQPSTSALRSLDKPEKSASADENRPGTSSRILRPLDRPSTSSATSNSIPQAARTPLRNNNDNSIFDMSSDYNIFSPTKRRVYGRSPLKNITSEVNNTSSPSFESVKSAPRSFGVLPKSSLNSIQTTVNSIKSVDVTLPEASYFSSRRAAQVFDRNIDNQSFADECFGFDDCDDDEEITNETTNKESEAAESAITTTKTEAEKLALKEIRAKLKRFLHNPDAERDESIKMSKVASKQAISDKNKPKIVKDPAKVVKSPAKPKRNVVFADAGAKQKDIRNAFTVKSSDTRKKDNSKDDPVTLFEEVDTVQDRRRSYSRPQRQRKRRISIECESEEEQHSEDEDYDENGKKRAKRRKKTTEQNPNELEELEEFARQTNQHFDEIDSFEMVVE